MDKINVGHICSVVASRSVNVNSSNANFNVANVEDGNVNSNNNYLCNSNSSSANDNGNSESVPVRPVASANCGYINIVYIRDNVETVCKRSIKRRIETSDNILYNTGLPEVYFIL